MSKLLVTGGAGFIGSNFIRLWFNNNPGDKIVNLDNLSYAGNLSSLKDLEVNSNYSFVEGDICDADLVSELISDIDVIVHFAAESHVDRSILNSFDFIKTNVEGTRVLLDAVKKRPSIHFHHISTDEVFGSLQLDDVKFNENTKYDPRSPYSASKAASDHLVRAYFHTHNLNITISNCSNNYGPYQFPEKLIPLFLTNLIDKKKIPLYGSGHNIRDWIYVDDHNLGIEAILKRGKIGETYCLGGNNEKTNIDITKMILDKLGYQDDMIEYVEDRLGHDFRYAIDYSKAESELNWTPQTSFEEGLDKTILWYKENESWWRDILNNKKK